ncbi:MAG TPA: 3-keto-5-aminohexanoate cleavage protein [Chitinophagaceae bacterium]
MEKLIITAAICGAEVTKQHNPAVPYTVEEYVREAKLASDAGASIIHLHVRTDDGTPTQDKERFREVMNAINAAIPDVIIQPSTGGAVGMSNEERLQPTELQPEMATLDCGTLNFGGDEVFMNTENTIKEFGTRMISLGIKPELEVFDKSMIEMALRLAQKGYIEKPMHFNLVMGVNGGIGGELRDFVFMRGSLPADATYSVAGIGRFEFPLAAAAIIDGGHVRVGLEDNVFLAKGVLARSNGELVAKVVRLATEMGRGIATPAEARRILSIKPVEITAF